VHRISTRSERARVARRVRALLDAQHQVGSAVPAAPRDDGGRIALRRDPGSPLGGVAEPRPSWSAPAEDPPTEDPQAAGEAVPLGARLVRPGGGAPGRLEVWLQRRGVHLNPGRRGAAAVGAATLVAALVAGWWVLAGRPHAVGISPLSRAATAAASRPGAAAASRPAPAAAPGVPAAGAAGGVVVVDVVGKVRRPGVYRLALGSRVDDVLRAAGGALPGVGLDSLNLARKVADGEQIAVGVPAAPAAGPAPSGPVGGSSGPVDLNTASPEQLDALPGVGPVLAQRIVDWRTAHGRFDSIDQLREVSGIGPSKFDDIRSLVTV
jgi:competence protein ComEA